jgi:hypothetical protein
MAAASTALAATSLSFTTDATTFSLAAGSANVGVSGLDACAGQPVRIGFSADGAIPLVGVATVSVSAAGQFSTGVELPPAPGDYVLVVFDVANATGCVPGGRAVSGQRFIIVHDVPAIAPALPPPALPPGVTFTLNKITPYSGPADTAVVWTVSGLTSCTGMLNAHLVDEDGELPPALWASAAVSGGVAAFTFPLTPIAPGRYYAYIGEACSGAVMTPSPVTVLAAFATVTPVATPVAPQTGTGPPHSSGEASLPFTAAGVVLMASATAWLLVGRWRPSGFGP